MHASQFRLEGLPASLLKSKFSAKASSPSATAPPSSLADGGLDAAEAAGLGSGALGWGGDTFAGAGTAAGLGSAHLGWGGDTFAGRGTAAGLGSGALGWGGDTFAVAGVAVASAVGERQRLVAWVEVPTQPLWVTLPLEVWWPWLHFLPWNALHSRE